MGFPYGSVMADVLSVERGNGSPLHYGGFGTVPSSRGLGHHPLKVETRVRTPLGLLSVRAGQRGNGGFGGSPVIQLRPYFGRLSISHLFKISDFRGRSEVRQSVRKGMVPIVGGVLIPKGSSRAGVSTLAHDLRRAGSSHCRPGQSSVAKVMESEIRSTDRLSGNRPNPVKRPRTEWRIPFAGK